MYQNRSAPSTALPLASVHVRFALSSALCVWDVPVCEAVLSGQDRCICSPSLCSVLLEQAPVILVCWRHILRIEMRSLQEIWGFQPYPEQWSQSWKSPGGQGLPKDRLVTKWQTKECVNHRLNTTWGVSFPSLSLIPFNLCPLFQHVHPCPSPYSLSLPFSCRPSPFPVFGTGLHLSLSWIIAFRYASQPLWPERNKLLPQAKGEKEKN